MSKIHQQKHFHSMSSQFKKKVLSFLEPLFLLDLTHFRLAPIKDYKEVKTWKSNGVRGVSPTSLSNGDALTGVGDIGNRGTSDQNISRPLNVWRVQFDTHSVAQRRSLGRRKKSQQIEWTKRVHGGERSACTARRGMIRYTRPCCSINKDENRLKLWRHTRDN